MNCSADRWTSCRNRPRNLACAPTSNATAVLSSNHDPADSLADIIENADRIAGYLTGLARQAFERSAIVRDAVERCLERVCEAAHRLGDQASAQMPNQPWADTRGMGNRLRHAYDRVNFDLILQTVSQEVPSLAVDARQTLETLQTERADNELPSKPPT